MRLVSAMESQRDHVCLFGQILNVLLFWPPKYGQGLSDYLSENPYFCSDSCVYVFVRALNFEAFMEA